MICLNSDTDFRLGFDRASRIHDIYVLVRLIHRHLKVLQFVLVLAIVVNTTLVEVLIDILHGLIILLLRTLIFCEKFDESIVRHILSRLDKTLSLEFDVTFLCHILLIESFLLNFFTFEVWIQI